MQALRKWRALGVAFAITLTAGLAIAQQSSVGGMTSRPRFSAVGVGVAAPAAGSLTATGTVTAANVTATGTVTAANYVGNVGGVAQSDFARISQGQTFTQNQQISAAQSATNALRVGITSSTDLGYDIGAVRAGSARIGVRNHADSVEGMMLAQAAAEGVVYGALTDHRVVIRQNNDDRIVIDNAGTVSVTSTSAVNFAAPAIQVNGVNVRAPLQAVKAANTSRNTTTTPAADADLTLSLAANTTYTVEAYLPWGCATVNTGGMRARFNFTGTTSFRFYNAHDSFAGPLAQLGAGDSAWDDANTSGTATCTTTIGGQFRTITGSLATTSTGTLTVHWAQQVSNGANVTLRAGAWMRATPI